MNFSCHAVFSPDIVLTDSARADEVFVSVRACQEPVAETIISFFGSCLEESECFSLKACIESLDYRITGKTLPYAVTVTVICAVAIFLCAVRVFFNWLCSVARVPVYLLTCLFRC